MRKKTKKTKVRQERKPQIKEKPARIVDIDMQIYRDLFKFLEEKVSVECFVDLHEQCFGKASCECECHKKGNL